MKVMGRPLWATLFALACLVPLAFYPLLLSRVDPQLMVFVKLYIPYTLLTAWLAWLCWPRRREMYWILLLLLLLTHAAMWLPALCGWPVE